MKIASQIWQKEFESPEWFREEIVYFLRSENQWITEIWEYNRDEKGRIYESILKKRKTYPRGSKSKIMEKFPWLKHRNTWTDNYERVKNY